MESPHSLARPGPKPRHPRSSSRRSVPNRVHKRQTHRSSKLSRGLSWGTLDHNQPPDVPRYAEHPAGDEGTTIRDSLTGKTGPPSPLPPPLFPVSSSMKLESNWQSDGKDTGFSPAVGRGDNSLVDSQHQHPDNSPSNPGPPKRPPDHRLPSNLPSGWFSTVDYESGRECYYSADGQTTYVRPTLPPLPPSTFQQRHRQLLRQQRQNNMIFQGGSNTAMQVDPVLDSMNLQAVTSLPPHRQQLSQRDHERRVKQQRRLLVAQLENPLPQPLDGTAIKQQAIAAARRIARADMARTKITRGYQPPDQAQRLSDEDVAYQLMQLGERAQNSQLRRKMKTQKTTRKPLSQRQLTSHLRDSAITQDGEARNDAKQQQKPQHATSTPRHENSPSTCNPLEAVKNLKGGYTISEDLANDERKAMRSRLIAIKGRSKSEAFGGLQSRSHLGVNKPITTTNGQKAEIVPLLTTSPAQAHARQQPAPSISRTDADRDQVIKRAANLLERESSSQAAPPSPGMFVTDLHLLHQKSFRWQ